MVELSDSMMKHASEEELEDLLVPASIVYTRINTTFRAQLEDNGGSM